MLWINKNIEANICKKVLDIIKYKKSATHKTHQLKTNYQKLKKNKNKKNTNNWILMKFSMIIK